MRVRVAVPASVANLGPGFDILALALQLQNEVYAEQSGSELRVDPGPDAAPALRDPRSNLVTRAYSFACEQLAAAPGGVQFRCVNRIPIGRGLGSSAAAALGGILAAVALHHAPWDEERVLACAAELEGHRDNAAAALFGGLAICAPEVPVARCDVADELRAVVFLPESTLATSVSRQLVPASFSRADAIFNASRCALLVRALVVRDHAGLRSAMQDRWHEEARFSLLPGSRSVAEAALDAGAAGASLAGAGPSILALTALDPAPVESAMARAAAAAGIAGSTMVLAPRNFGTRVDVGP